MRITFVVPAPNLSGGARVVAIYAEKLQARGHDVTVVAQRRRQPTRNDNIKSLLRGRLPTKPDTRSHFDGMRATLRIVDHTGPITNADVPDADVVIATWWETAYMVAGFSPEKGRKFYFIQHYEDHNFLPRHISVGSYHLPLNNIV